MVYLGYMIPVTKETHDKIIELSNLNEVSPETFITGLLKDFERLP